MGKAQGLTKKGANKIAKTVTETKETTKSTEVISIINQKGGVGKSTTAMSLGTGLFHRGKKVLLVDLDGQTNLTFSMGINSDKSIMDVIINGEAIENIIVNTTTCDLIPSNQSLYNAGELISDIGKEYKLKEALEQVKSGYDYIIIDTPPALGIITVNALTASDSVIIPAEASPFSLSGIGQLKSTIDAVKQYCNNSLVIRGIVMTMYTDRAIISRDMLELTENMATELKTSVFSTKIRKCLALTEAQASQQDIFTYAPKSNATIDYNNLIDEILKGRE